MNGANISYEINISGLNKAAVLAALYNNANAQGNGHHVAATFPDEMTIDDAQSILGRVGKPDFEYIGGRVLKINLQSDLLDSSRYDRDNGSGKAKAVIDRLRLDPTNISRINDSAEFDIGELRDLTTGDPLILNTDALKKRLQEAWRFDANMLNEIAAFCKELCGYLSNEETRPHEFVSAYLLCIETTSLKNFGELTKEALIASLPFIVQAVTPVEFAQSVDALIEGYRQFLNEKGDSSHLN